MLRCVHKIASYFARLEVLLLAVILLAMVVMAVLQIVLRNLFDTSLFWVEPLNRILVLWIAILGAMVATREKAHIAVDVLKHYLTGRSLTAMSKCIEIFASLICLVMSYHSFRFVYYEYLDGMATFSGLPSWPFELIMPIGFLVMGLRFGFAAIFNRDMASS